MTANAPRVVLFDLEGTLVDFQWNLAGAAADVKRVLAELGYDLSGWDDHYAALRNNALALASQRGLDPREVARQIDAIYDRYDLDAASRWSLMPVVPRLLPWLKKQNVRVGLVTNIGRLATEQGSATLGLAGAFEAVITRNDVARLKPCGDGIRLALGQLGAVSSDALFVGDSVSDVLAAKDAGVKVAIVQGGESAPTSLRAAAPDFLWQTLGELDNLYSGGEAII